ncbi:hypothetical protein P9761_03810 [Brevibacillus centrosporus]|jgi:hypothetical protein|nr:hypothetical protein [Brevibacillus centrosporus]
MKMSKKTPPLLLDALAGMDTAVAGMALALASASALVEEELEGRMA